MSNALLESKNKPAPEEDVSVYLQQIRQYPRLTPEEERTLAMGCARGDTAAIREMVNANLRLVVSVAREYGGRGVPLLDLIQEGSIGLIVAAKKFDYTRNLKFSTYATKWIRQGITRYIMNHAGLIRVPQHTLERIRKLQTAQRQLQQTGQTPDVAALSACTGIPEKKVGEYLSLIPEVCSLDAPGGEDGSGLWVLEDIQTPQPQEELIRRELKQIMEALLGMLPERQQQVLRLHFGMEDGICYSLEQIGSRLGVSKERARQICRQAMDKLQELGAGFGLEDFLT